FLLLLRSGRLEMVRERESEFGDPTIQFLYAAATGDYGRADEYLQTILGGLERVRNETLFTLFRADPTPPYPMPAAEYLRIFTRLGETTTITAEWADWLVLRGVVALEAGNNGAAERDFR